MAIGRQGDIDDAGLERGHRRRPKAAWGQTAGTVALCENIGIAYLSHQIPAILIGAQIEMGTALAAAYIDGQFGH